MKGRAVFSALFLTTLALLMGAWFTLHDGNPDISISFRGSRVLIIGQIGRTLMHTNLLALNGVPARFAVPAGLTDFRQQSSNADVIITGEADPVARVGTDFDGQVVACLGLGGKIALLVPEGSDFKRIADLRSANIDTMLGDSLHRWTIQTIVSSGLRERDVTLEQFHGLESLKDPQVGAVVLWEPLVHWATIKGYRETAYHGQYFVSVLFSRRLLQRRQLAIRTLVALKQAAWYVAQNHARANGWLPESASVPPSELDRMSSINGLYTCTNFATLSIKPDLPQYLRCLQADVQFLEAHGFLNRPVSLANLVNRELAAEADRLAQPYDAERLHVIDIQK